MPYETQLKAGMLTRAFSGFPAFTEEELLKRAKMAEITSGKCFLEFGVLSNQCQNQILED